MVSYPSMGIQDLCDRAMASRNGGSLSSKLSNVARLCGNDYAPKIRKPYTISKQRERWTDEEHKKFIEALKLYGRAWRRIQEHMGTKTAVQIRSHAQKFFSKIAHDSRGASTSSEEQIEVPPPRPKRKPTYPYPRKLVIPPIKGISISHSETTRSRIVSERENQSPTSVLSAFGSDAYGSIASNSLNSSADEQHSTEHELFPGEESTEEATTRRFKLFGKTVLVTVTPQPSSQAAVSSKSIFDINEGKPIQPLARKFVPGKGLPENLECSWPNVEPGLFKQEMIDAFPDTKVVLIQGKEFQMEGSSAGSNSGSVNYAGEVEESVHPETQSCQHSPDNSEPETAKVSKFKTSKRSAFSQLKPSPKKQNLKGFVPYKKRRIAEIANVQSSLLTAEVNQYRKSTFIYSSLIRRGIC